VDVDLREALAPVNRGHGGQQAGQFVPALRTAAQLRERAAAGVLDLKLSRACFIGGALLGTCLVERVGERAHLDAVSVEPLAQQRGAGRALVDAVFTAAAAAGVKRLSAYVSDFDGTLQAILQGAGASRLRTVVRHILSGAPAPLPQPRDLEELPAPEDLAEACARTVPMSEALALLPGASDAGELLFSQEPEVLSRLSGRLRAHVYLEPRSKSPAAVVICERERKLLYTLSGATASLASLLCLVAARHGIACLDALPDGHPAEASLAAAGFARAALRAEWVKDL
jgi:GNAT superfamily N-acetyltransferase